MDAQYVTIYVDLDGVLADFDLSAGRILKTNNIYKYEFVWGATKFWDELNRYPNFFRDLAPKSDMLNLWSKIEHLGPEILTALPRDNPERVEEQKRAWVADYIPGDPLVHCCQTKDKPTWCQPGDVLIDDRAVNRDAWIKAGGIYVIHTSAASTVTTLQALGII